MSRLQLYRAPDLPIRSLIVRCYKWVNRRGTQTSEYPNNVMLLNLHSRHTFHVVWPMYFKLQVPYMKSSY
jgi:hypothetical protein